MRTILLFTLLLGFQCTFSQNDPLLKSALAKQKEGKHPGAISDLSAVIKNHEAGVQEYLKRLEQYRSSGDTSMKNFPLIDRSYAIPYCLRGISYAATDKNTEAMNDFNTAINIDPSYGAAYYQRGKLQWALGKKDESCVDMGMAGSLGDTLAKDLFGYNFCWRDAVAAYKDAVSKLKLSLHQDALDLIQRSLRLCPDSARYLVLRGNCFAGLGKTDLAIADFNKALALKSVNADAYFGRGLCYYSKEKFDAAFDDIDKAIQQNAKLTDAYLYRAYVCEKLGKNESALYDYQQVQQMRPYDALAFYKSGLINYGLNSTKGACQDFKKAAALGNTEAADYVKKMKCK